MTTAVVKIRPEIETSPEALLGMFLSRREDIEDFVLICRWKDGVESESQTEVYHTKIDLGRLVWMLKIYELWVNNMVRADP